MPTATVVAVSRDTLHRFSKQPQESITLIEGMGVAGDAHAGTLVQHRSRKRRQPNQVNLRQVHLIHAELLDELAGKGHVVAPGELGENITTRGLPVLELPTGTLLHLGEVVLRVTGLRNPCRQIEDFQPGLLRHVVERDDGVPTAAEPDLGPTGGVQTVEGRPIRRKAGVMATIERGGEVRAGQEIRVELPAEPHRPLEPV